MIARRLPAYGRQIVQQRKAGQVPRSLYIVLDWDLAKAFPRIVITDDLPVKQLDLTFLAGLDCCVAFRAKDSHRVPELAQVILKAKPRILNAFNVTAEKNFIIKNYDGTVLL